MPVHLDNAGASSEQVRTGIENVSPIRVPWTCRLRIAGGAGLRLVEDAEEVQQDNHEDWHAC